MQLLERELGLGAHKGCIASGRRRVGLPRWEGKLQELMGHATIEMPMSYAHLAPEARESAAQQLDQHVPQLHAAPARDAGGVH